MSGARRARDQPKSIRSEEAAKAPQELGTGLRIEMPLPTPPTAKLTIFGERKVAILPVEKTFLGQRQRTEITPQSMAFLDRCAE